MGDFEALLSESQQQTSAALMSQLNNLQLSLQN